MAFMPEEVLFSPTTSCNLTCSHCVVPRSKTKLSARKAINFLKSCKQVGIRRLGFTGGEPFIERDFLCAITRSAVEQGFLFDRIMTNAVWWSNARELKSVLTLLFDSGYDGTLCVSFDAFHGQDARKVERFIRRAMVVWRRPDIVSLACVTGARQGQTNRMLASLAKHLDARLGKTLSGQRYIKSPMLFIKIHDIGLSAAGRLATEDDPWNGRWFKEDYCKGPGNVLLVMPDGSVKPCCGYASDSKELTIGNIKTDTAAALVRRFTNNRFALTVFNSGLSALRKRLEFRGIRFPGRTSDHCFFCDYVIKNIPKGIVEQCLDK